MKPRLTRWGKCLQENVPGAGPDSDMVRTEFKKQLDDTDDSETAELFLQEMLQAHRARGKHMEQLLSQQHQLALSMSLP